MALPGMLTQTQLEYAELSATVSGVAANLAINRHSWQRTSTPSYICHRGEQGTLLPHNRDAKYGPLQAALRQARKRRGNARRGRVLAAESHDSGPRIVQPLTPRQIHRIWPSSLLRRTKVPLQSRLVDARRG